MTNATVTYGALKKKILTLLFYKLLTWKGLQVSSYCNGTHTPLLLLALVLHLCTRFCCTYFAMLPQPPTLSRGQEMASITFSSVKTVRQLLRLTCGSIAKVTSCQFLALPIDSFVLWHQPSNETLTSEINIILEFKSYDGFTLVILW